ncbi:MAG: methyltransferase domain-containing protein [Halomonadaceae bacterium]|nr:MAG: methyltransferase domain-containing protein [Halomonadaceae bacterium]
MPSNLHEDRLDLVAQWLDQPDITSVLDLGCGSGSLLQRLVHNPRLRRILGVEQSGMLIHQAKHNLAGWLCAESPLQFRQGSFTDTTLPFTGFDAATLVETIEHVDPGQLALVERAVFAHYRPGQVIITTPNGEYNPLLGLGPGEKRDPDHRFEWPRDRFRKWCLGIAGRQGYQVRISGIGEADDQLGSPTQVARFTRLES